jgi:chromosome segregation ATPase
METTAASARSSSSSLLREVTNTTSNTNLAALLSLDKENNVVLDDDDALVLLDRCVSFKKKGKKQGMSTTTTSKTTSKISMMNALETKYRSTLALLETQTRAIETLETKNREREGFEVEKWKSRAKELEREKREETEKEKTWREAKESETREMREKVDELKRQFERKMEESETMMASMEMERCGLERAATEAKKGEREAKAEADRARAGMETIERESIEKEEKIRNLEEDVGRLKEALLERRKTQDDVEQVLRETKKKCARLEGELRGRRMTRKNRSHGGHAGAGSPTTTLTLATTPHTNGERPPWDDSFHTSANKGIDGASTSICPIAFPDTPMSNSTAHRSPSSPSNNNNNDDELRDAFRNVKAFGQEIAHSWRERATRAEARCEHLERNVKAIKEKLVDEQLKNAKFLDEQKITKATISRLETENATKESGQSSARKECERLSALLSEANERNVSIETICKKHRESALDASKRVSAAESILDALKAKEREASRLKELSEQRLQICERELQATSSELEKAKEHAWKMVEVQELTMRRAEVAEKKLIEITSSSSSSSSSLSGNNGGTTTGPGFEGASPSIDAWIKTPANGQTLMTPSVTRGFHFATAKGPGWTRTPLRRA